MKSLNILTLNGRRVEFLQNYIYFLKHKAGVENRVDDALSRHRALLSVMSTKVAGFKKIKHTMNHAQILKIYSLS